MGLKTFGLMAVDWEERVNIERLRQERLARVNEVCQRRKAGLILVHHNTKTSRRQNKNKPPELDDLAWSGVDELGDLFQLVAETGSRI